MCAGSLGKYGPGLIAHCLAKWLVTNHIPAEFVAIIPSDPHDNNDPSNPTCICNILYYRLLVSIIFLVCLNIDLNHDSKDLHINPTSTHTHTSHLRTHPHAHTHPHTHTHTHTHIRIIYHPPFLHLHLEYSRLVFQLSPLLKLLPCTLSHPALLIHCAWQGVHCSMQGVIVEPAVTLEYLSLISTRSALAGEREIHSTIYTCISFSK